MGEPTGETPDELVRMLTDWFGINQARRAQPALIPS